nr:hypothetical protein [Candidatus Sigynarchaeota archaeon]
MEQPDAVQRKNGNSVINVPKGKVATDRLGIFLATFLFIALIALGVYCFIDDDFIIHSDSEYFGGAFAIGAFFLSPLLLRYAFKFDASRVRDVFFSQLSLLLVVLVFAAMILIPGATGLLTYNPWFSLAIVAAGIALQLLAWRLRTRPKFIVGGFLIAVASVMEFFGIMGLLAMKYII